jgi:hypothetical protein
MSRASICIEILQFLLNFLTHHNGLSVYHSPLAITFPDGIQSSTTKGAHSIDAAALLLIQKSTARENLVEFIFPILSQVAVHLFERLPVPPLDILEYYHPLQGCGPHTTNIYTARGTTLFAHRLGFIRLHQALVLIVELENLFFLLYKVQFVTRTL